MLQPLSNNLLIEPEEKQSASGIIIPETARKDRPSIGKVAFVGPDVKSVKSGDKVLVKTYMVDELSIDDKKFFICQEDAIIATIHD